MLRSRCADTVVFRRLKTSGRLWVQGVKEGLVKRTGFYVLSLYLAWRHVRRQFFDCDGVESSGLFHTQRAHKDEGGLMPHVHFIPHYP